jgi:hypothetical protein
MAPTEMHDLTSEVERNRPHGNAGCGLLGAMTARTYPDYPKFAAPVEQQVWQRLRDTLPGEALLLANLRIIDADTDHEADLVVLLPGAGVVVLEVKGGSVS